MCILRNPFEFNSMRDQSKDEQVMFKKCHFEKKDLEIKMGYFDFELFL